MGEAKRRKQQDPNYGKSAKSKNAKPEEVEGLTEDDYQFLVNEYLENGPLELAASIMGWMVKHDPPHLAYQTVDGKVLPNLDRLNKIEETVYILASKHSKVFSSKDLKRGEFKLRTPLDPDYFASHAPVRDNPELALEGMLLVNTGFFDKAITDLINTDGDSIGTLRNHVVVIYMGTNEEYEIIDAACSLASLKPFQIVKYAGEQRNSLDSKLERIFSPLTTKIDNFRVQKKGADKVPVLDSNFLY
ncbi:MAG: hypothetical protein WCK64_05865 [Synechococcaceae cyanobacterium ELA445]